MAFRVLSNNKLRFALSASIISAASLSRPYGNKSIPHYDLIVIGGGSGGLACAKQAADYGRKVAVLDYVTPSPQGTTWSLGGTCVNVGCIPKKLMHSVSLMNDIFKHSHHCGWKMTETPILSWEDMSLKVRNYVKSLNWNHKIQLMDKNVTYYNAKGSFADRNTIKMIDKHGKESQINGDHIVIAVGGRPRYPNIPGAIEYGITSDDIFWKKDSPGKTLVIGGSYVALECAGFLTGMDYPTTVMVRSICLRGFDQQMANLVSDAMESHGTNFIWRSVPESIIKDEKSGLLRVAWKSTDGSSSNSDTFNTVLFAIGRDAVTDDLELRNAGVETNPKNGKILGGYHSEAERTSVDNIFAIGDVLDGALELTPVAIKAGKLLADRLFNNSSETMNYKQVATTVFTPLEYSCVGLSEEEAIELYGNNGIEVYHAFFKPLEYNLIDKDAKQCYIKAICNIQEGNKIVGLHFTGPNAGEVMQGFSAAVNLGMTISHLIKTVGIHPTCAEEIVKLRITKSSGEDPTVTGC